MNAFPAPQKNGTNNSFFADINFITTDLDSKKSTYDDDFKNAVFSKPSCKNNTVTFTSPNDAINECVLIENDLFFDESNIENEATHEVRTHFVLLRMYFLFKDEIIKQLFNC